MVICRSLGNISIDRVSYDAMRHRENMSNWPAISRSAGPINCSGEETPVVEKKSLPDARNAVAPDGSDVRLLLGLEGGGMAHFALAPGETSTAVTHRIVREIWFFLSGKGQMWRQLGEESETVDVRAGVCLTIPLGTHFQFRSLGNEPPRRHRRHDATWPAKERR
jgi:mannose-6-phosphate isomerase-like protein (cupin superfamily)